MSINANIAKITMLAHDEINSWVVIPITIADIEAIAIKI